MQKLTARQQEVFSFVQQFMQENGCPPTRAEIARALGFRSANAAEEHLRALARKGAIEMLPGTSRGIRLPAQANAGLPVIGQVAAGSPLLAQEHIDRHVKLEADMFSPEADYLLTVKGRSMEKIGILDGDLLAVHRTQEAKNGQVVVARVNDEVTVKRLQVKGDTAWLLPENDEFEPIKVDLNSEALAIEGLAVGVLRKGLGDIH